MTRAFVGAYLFDWGDTLMVDFPGQTGKMRDWPQVAAVAGASRLLATLAKQTHLYVATGAADSHEDDIQAALERVELSQYFQGIFCQANLGVGKDSPEFFPKILARLNLPAQQLMMVGDSLERDIQPALAAGLQAVWFNPQQTNPTNYQDRQISQLHELI